MDWIKTILASIDIMLLIYFGIASVYFFVFALASLFYKENAKTTFNKKISFTLLIPAYKEDAVIIETVKNAYRQFCSYCDFKVVVVADKLKNTTIQQLEFSGAYVIPVYFKESTKAKALNHAMQFKDIQSDYVIVLDADNHMAPNFLDNLALKINEGYKVVQGERTAKNNNTNFAQLDGFSETINNEIFRKGHVKLGLSSAIIGSGFACEYHLFKRLMAKITAIGGFDKELEVALLKEKNKIAYAEQAIVYDEKTPKAEVFYNQRRRWLSAQFTYLKKYFWDSLKTLVTTGNIDYFDKVFQFALPPRVIALGIAGIASFVHVFIAFFPFGKGWGLFTLEWLLTSAFLVLSVSLPLINKNKFSGGSFKSLKALPMGFLLTLKAILHIKNGNKKFIHTPHGL